MPDLAPRETSHDRGRRALEENKYPIFPQKKRKEKKKYQLLLHGPSSFDSSDESARRSKKFSPTRNFPSDLYFLNFPPIFKSLSPATAATHWSKREEGKIFSPSLPHYSSFPAFFSSSSENNSYVFFRTTQKKGDMREKRELCQNSSHPWPEAALIIYTRPFSRKKNPRLLSSV